MAIQSLPHDDDTLDAHYSGLERLDNPHGCMGGYVFIGHMVEDESGEEIEVIEAYPCQRCAAESLTGMEV